MRFQKGIGYTGPRCPRGPGRGDPPYSMSRKAYDARLHNLCCVKKRRRTYEETRRNELEIALATHRGETYRAMAKQLGLSHVQCWRVARNYRNGLIPMLAEDEQGLLELRDSLERSPAPAVEPPAVHAPGCQCKACICPRCGKPRTPRSPSGYVYSLGEKCVCVEHSKDCGCAPCRIERVIVAAGPIPFGDDLR